MSNKEHWEVIYTTKNPQEVSWTQDEPKTSLDLIAKFQLPKSAKIIDIGGGDSLLADFLLDLGYTNITVLDISTAAVEKARTRLGDRADKVKWIVSDIRDFKPKESYDLWHDRAAFHFLTHSKDISNYVETLNSHSKNVVLGTFSTNGPLKCSGLEITQYDEAKLNDVFGNYFTLHECFNTNHITPFGTTQDFTFARMSKK